MKDTLAAEINHLEPSLVRLAPRLPPHPELGFQEHRTSEVVREFLESCGIEVRACGRTGLRRRRCAADGPA